MALLTLEAALALPDLRRAEPRVLAGADRLARPIRWVHATEQTDVGDLLRAGDLVLTMGTGLPADDDTAGLAAYARALAEVDAVGVVVELGRRWREAVPDGVVAAFEGAGVPLVALRHEVRFAALAQAIGESIVDAQVAELREAQRVHETFTELGFAQAGPAEILDAVQRLAGGAVVVESAQHRPLDYASGPTEMSGFLDGWQARSARVRLTGRTGWDAANGWLLARLGTDDDAWGRLVISSPGPPAQRMVAVAERAAAALALHRLHDRDRDNLARRTHRRLIEALQTDPDGEEVVRRCELAGFPTARRTLLAVVLRTRPGARGRGADDVAAAAVRAADGARVPALVCENDGDVQVLLSCTSPAAAEGAAERIAARLHSQHDVVIAAGRPAPDRGGVARALLEATHVADAAPAGSDVVVHRLEDLHLRGLLALLGDDERVRLFVERELAPLRALGPRGEDLLGALRALLTHPASKTDAAASLHLSRAAFYDRLARLEQTLGVDLDDADVRVSLHVALLADDLSASSRR